MFIPLFIVGPSLFIERITVALKVPCEKEPDVRSMVPDEEPHPVKETIEKKTRGIAITLGEPILQFFKFLYMTAILSNLV